MNYEIKFDPTPMLGGCEICLQNECGTEGSVQFPGMPIQIGLGCARRIAVMVPWPVVPQPEPALVAPRSSRPSRTSHGRARMA